jgi:hypothetical protein
MPFWRILYFVHVWYGDLIPKWKGPIIVISQSKSIMFLYWPFLENILSCAYRIWYGDLIAEWDRPIIVISQSKSIMFLYWPFLENIVSCAYCIWYGDLIAEWDGPIIVISRSKEIVFFHWALLENIVSCPYAKDKFHSELVNIGTFWVRKWLVELFGNVSSILVVLLDAGSIKFEFLFVESLEFGCSKILLCNFFNF